MKLESIEPRFVTYVPAELERGVLYVCLEYCTAVHVCDTKTVTPLGADDWMFIFDGTATLHPSIGNGQAPCDSHYLVRQNRIIWLRPMDKGATRAAIARDQVLQSLAVSRRVKKNWWTHIRETLFAH